MVLPKYESVVDACRQKNFDASLLVRELQSATARAEIECIFPANFFDLVQSPREQLWPEFHRHWTQIRNNTSLIYIAEAACNAKDFELADFIVNETLKIAKTEDEDLEILGLIRSTDHPKRCRLPECGFCSWATTADQATNSIPRKLSVASSPPNPIQLALREISRDDEEVDLVWETISITLDYILKNVDFTLLSGQLMEHHIVTYRQLSRIQNSGITSEQRIAIFLHDHIHRNWKLFEPFCKALEADFGNVANYLRQTHQDLRTRRPDVQETRQLREK